MKNISIVARLYMGFGLICLIVASWGTINWWTMTQMDVRIRAISQDALPLQRQSADTAMASLRIGKQVLDLLELKNQERVAVNYDRIRQTIVDERASAQAIVSRFKYYPQEVGLTQSLDALDDEFSALEIQTGELQQLLVTSLEVNSKVKEGVSAFLLSASEIKQSVIQNSRKQAAEDIYVADLVSEVMNRFANIEFVILNIINTDDPQKLAELVELIRFNSKAFDGDVSDLIEEVPGLAFIDDQKTMFLDNINSEQGVVSQYYAYRKNLDLINQTKLSVMDRIDAIDAIMREAVAAGETKIIHASTKLERFVASSTSLIFVLVPLALACSLLISYLLARLINRPLQDTTRQLASMASGDYSNSMSENYSGEFRQLSASVNTLVREMESVITELQRSSTELAEVSVANQGVSVTVKEGLEQQNGELSSAASALTQMEAAVTEVAQVTQHSQDLAQQVTKDVNRGQQVMLESLDNIDSLSEQMQHTSGVVANLARSVDEIDSIRKVIEEVANRTNLLALNAAIEAARAGENGRGFAVVADEVRQLATQTTHSTDSIRDMIASLQAESQQAVSAMQQSQALLVDSKQQINQTSESMSSIRGQVTEISASSMQISSAISQQQQATVEVTGNVTIISSASATNFTHIEELAGNGILLGNRIVQTDELIKRFKV